MTEPWPNEMRLASDRRSLKVDFGPGETFEIPAELLRVKSPSAEVKGHGPGQEILVLGKQNVRIIRVEPVGHYAVRLVFDDGHSTGIYTWPILYDLGHAAGQKLADYRAKAATCADA